MTETQNKSGFNARVRKAMEIGEFETDASLARALTRLLHDYRLLSHSEKIPYQTIQSMRTNGFETSKYTLHVAKLCGVNPFWLAFGEGSPRAAMTIDGGTWPFRIEKFRYDRLPTAEKIRIDAEVEARIVEVEEEPNNALKGRRANRARP